MSFTLHELFESKAHLGHLARYWHPKMKPFIFDKQNGMYRIDLDQAQFFLKKALSFLKELGSRPGTKVLFVGTKRAAQAAIKEHAMRAGMPYVNQYWRGGNLTNYRISSLSAKVLKDMEAAKQRDGFGADMTKKEIRNFERNLTRLEKGVGGIKDMIGLPDALFVIDIGTEKIAVSEARKLRIPVIGVVDTNHSPEGIDYVIPGNDDAIAAVALYTKLAADAIIEGRQSIAALSQDSYTPPPIIKKVKKSASSSEIAESM